MTEAILVFALAIGLGWPLGRYLAAVMRGGPMRGDRAILSGGAFHGRALPRERDPRQCGAKT